MADTNLADLKKQLIAEANASRRAEIEYKLKQEIMSIMNKIDSNTQKIEAYKADTERLRKVLAEWEIPEIKDIEV